MADDQNNEYEKNRQLSLQAETLEAINKLAENRVALENDTYQAIINENNLIENQLKALREQNKEGQQRANEQRELNKLNRDLLGISRSISSVTASELGSEKLQKQLANDRAKTSSQILQLKKLQAEYLQGESELEKDIALSIGYQIDNAQRLNNELAKTLEVSQAINEDGFLKSFKTLKHIIDLVPGLSKILPGFNQAAEAYRKTLILNEQEPGLTKDQAADLNKKMAAYKSGDKEGTKGLTQDYIKSLPKEIQETLNGTTGTAGLAILSNKFKDGVTAALSPLRAAFIALQTFLKEFILVQLVMAILKADKVAGDLAKSFNVTYQEALQIENEMWSMANGFREVDDVLYGTSLTMKQIAETQLFINKQLGTSAMLTREQARTFSMLRDRAGFTNEELQGMLGISLSTGKEMKKITGEVIAQAKYTGLKYGVSLNEREIAKEISKVSAATTLSLGKNPGAIAKAVATAKALGMELSKVEQIASSLLNFESSIEDELSAELLIGKELNLEAARYYALTNDIAGVASEIASQIGTAADFMEMNYLQQNALAKAVGMNREELAQTLYVQEQLAGLSGDEAKKKEKILNARIAEVGLAQAMQEMEEDGYETLLQQASAQDRILELTNKLTDLVVTLAPAFLSIADILVGTIEPIMGIIAPIFEGVSWVVGLIAEGLKVMAPYLQAVLIPLGIMYGMYKLMTTELKLQAIFSSMSNPWKAVAGIAAAGLIAGAISRYSNADDMMEGPTAGAGYGDRILVNTNTGQQTALSNADTISATRAGGASTPTATPIIKLYLDNEEIANSQIKGMSRL